MLFKILQMSQDMRLQKGLILNLRMVGPKELPSESSPHQGPQILHSRFFPILVLDLAELDELN